MKFKNLIGKNNIVQLDCQDYFRAVLKNQRVSHSSSGIYTLCSASDVDKTLLHQRFYFICSQGYVVDADIVDQAREEMHINNFAGANVQTAISGF